MCPKAPDKKEKLLEIDTRVCTGELATQFALSIEEQKEINHVSFE
jgi:hypothetical protein